MEVKASSGSHLILKDVINHFCTYLQFKVSEIIFTSSHNSAEWSSSGRLPKACCMTLAMHYSEKKFKAC